MRVFPCTSIVALATSSPLQPSCLSRPLVSGQRCLHQTSGFRAKEPVIFKNSLEKTLESHRSCNRAGLIRRVFNKDPRQGPHTPDDDPRRKLPTGSSSTQQAPRSKQPRRLASQHSPSPSRPATPPSQRIDWSTSATGRPEQSPWLDLLAKDRAVSGGLSQLDAEIRALETYLTPSPAEQQSVKKVISEVTNLLQGVVPRTPLVIGSRRTGFALGHSGLDFIIPVFDNARFSEQIRKPSASRPQMLEQYREILQNAQDAFCQHPSFWHRVHLSGKRKPIVTVTHRSTGLSIHLTCGGGLPSFIEYLHDYFAEYPSTRPLYMVTRLILEIHGLYGTHTSGIGSDALVMLVVTFLKMNHGRFHGPSTLGSQLLAILHTYGTRVDLATTGVSVDPPGFFNADTVKEASAGYNSDDLPAYLRGQRSLVNLKRTAAARRNVPATGQLCLQDPGNYMNDLGRGCTRTREIQDAFARAHRRLKKALGAWEDHGSENSTANSILSPVLRANFDSYGQRRAQIFGVGS